MSLKKLILLIVFVCSYLLFLNNWTDKDLLIGEWKSLDSKIEIIFGLNSTYSITIGNSIDSGHYVLKKSFIGVRWIELKGSADPYNNYPNVISNDYQLRVKGLKPDSLLVNFGQSQVTKPYSSHMKFVK